MRSVFSAYLMSASEAVLLASLLGSCGFWARSLTHDDALECAGDSRWRITSQGGRVVVFSIVSRNLPPGHSHQQRCVIFTTRNVDRRAAGRVDSYIDSLGGVRRLGGFAFCWDPQEDELDPLSVTMRVRLLMMPLWAPTLLLGMATSVAVFGRSRRQRPEFSFEVQRVRGGRGM
jgi:hypothetical protein